MPPTCPPAPRPRVDFTPHRVRRFENHLQVGIAEGRWWVSSTCWRCWYPVWAIRHDQQAVWLYCGSPTPFESTLVYPELYDYVAYPALPPPVQL